MKIIVNVISLLAIFLVASPTVQSQTSKSEKQLTNSQHFDQVVTARNSVGGLAVQGNSKEEIVQIDACTYRLTLITKAKPETIWKLWEDVDNWKDYDTILQYSYLKDEAEFAVGAIGYVKAEGAPKTKFEIIQVDSGNSFIESLKLPLWSTLELKRYVSKNSDGDTVFTHEVEFKGWMKRAYYLLLAKTFKKELHLVMGRMRDLAETRDLAAKGQ